MGLLYIVFQEELSTKVNHKYSKVWTIREQKKDMMNYFEGCQVYESRSLEQDCSLSAEAWPTGQQTEVWYKEDF